MIVSLPMTPVCSADTSDAATLRMASATRVTGTARWRLKKRLTGERMLPNVVSSNRALGRGSSNSRYPGWKMETRWKPVFMIPCSV